MTVEATMFTALALLMQASLPNPNMPFNKRIDYSGPGLVCGAAFSVNLRKGETAVLIKPSNISGDMKFNTYNGRFTVRESQYATTGATRIRKLPLGMLSRKRENGEYTWIYTDNAPGSTDIFGKGVNTRKPSPALNRFAFGSPHQGFVGLEKCLDGTVFAAK